MKKVILRNYRTLSIRIDYLQNNDDFENEVEYVCENEGFLSLSVGVSLVGIL